MQIIQGYNNFPLPNKLKLRLFYIDHPNLKKWRLSRKTKTYKLDRADKIVLSLCDSNLVSVGGAGWYFEDFGVNTQCFENNDLAKIFYPKCFIEYDLNVHRPTYTNDYLVYAKFPNFLKYNTLNEFVFFINIWCKKTMVLNFYHKHLQYNYLKYDLKDLVQPMLKFNINEITPGLWIIRKEE